MEFETSHLVMLLVVIVVLAAAYWWWFMSAPSPVQSQLPHIPATPGAKELIDKYNALIYNTSFTNALLRPARDKVEIELPSEFSKNIHSAKDEIKVSMGVALGEMARVAGAIGDDPKSQRELASGHALAMSALKKSSPSDLGAAVDALKRIAPAPMPVTMRA